jgi:hypothetical protein
LGSRRPNRNQVPIPSLNHVKKIFRPYWRSYYPNTHAIIYVVDSADKDRIGISKEELLGILEV